MTTARAVWSVIWLSCVAAFAVAYWRVERARAQADDARFRARLRNWAEWSPWRDKIIRQEFEVSE